MGGGGHNRRGDGAAAPHQDGTADVPAIGRGGGSAGRAAAEAIRYRALQGARGAQAAQARAVATLQCADRHVCQRTREGLLLPNLLVQLARVGGVRGAAVWPPVLPRLPAPVCDGED
eukprot:7383386-Prymnesium_polylepis.1